MTALQLKAGDKSVVRWSNLAASQYPAYLHARIIDYSAHGNTLSGLTTSVTDMDTLALTTIFPYG